MMKFFPSLCGVVILLHTVACNRGVDPAQPDASPPAGPAWFTEQASTHGLSFTWESGHEQRHYLPESIGGGVALFDMDGDGDLDAYLVQGGRVTNPEGSNPPNQLFENTGDGTFRDVTDGSGADDRGYGMGVACGDYDGDGDIDLYVTNVGRNTLLRNDGSGQFTDRTIATGVGNPDWGTGCLFIDFDRDGDLDLFALNYVNWNPQIELECFNGSGAPDYCLPTNYSAPGRAVLYRNDGDGTFSDSTVAAGFETAVGTGLGVLAGDFNSDGWPDLFIANDGMPDQLWFNRRDGTFTEMGMVFGAALDQEGRSKAGMGVTAADIDDDADLDLLVCNLRDESDSLFINEGTYFRDGTILARLSAASRRFTRFGVGWIDFDNDGYLDLYESNGRVESQSDTHASDSYAEPNQLFRGSPKLQFEPVLPRGGTAAQLIHTSRGAAFGDVNNDGGVDVVIINRDGPAYLLINEFPSRGHWMLLDVVDGNGHTAIGATVAITIGNRTVRRDVRPAYSYLSSCDPRVHFGLGDVGVDQTVEVTWPDGGVNVFEGVPVDQVSRLVRGVE